MPFCYSVVERLQGNTHYRNKHIGDVFCNARAIGEAPMRAALATAFRRPWHVAVTTLSALWLIAFTA